MTAKNIMCISRRAPHGSCYPQEGLEVALIGAAFEQQICLGFLDDGVFQLRAGQATEALGFKDFAATFAALGDFEVNKVYVEAESLAQRGLGESDLVQIRHPDTARSMLEILPSAAFAELLHQQDILLNF